MVKFIIDLLAGLTPPALLGLLIYAILNLLVPQKIIDKINIARLDERTARRMWHLLIGSFSLLVGILFVDLYNSGLKPFYNDYMSKVRQERRLNNLTKDEVKVLKYYVEKDTDSYWLCARSWVGAVKTLERDGILFMAKERKDKYEYCYCYNIERWALFYLKRHKELVTTST